MVTKFPDWMFSTVAVKAPAKEYVPPAEFKVNVKIEFEILIALEPVPSSVNVKDDTVALDPIVTPPYDVSVPLMEPFSNVPVRFAQVALEQVTAIPVPELTSKTTSSPLVGTDCPPAPPDVSDQFVVVVASHVPDPPTQYLMAMNFPISFAASRPRHPNTQPGSYRAIPNT